MDKLEEFHYFTTPVYAVKKPDFLPAVRAVSKNYLNKSRAQNNVKKPITLMSGDYSHEKSIAPFAQYVSQTAWNILNAQGYNVDHKVTYFLEMWSQEHNHMSHIEPHVHHSGSQISAFYFLDVPKDGCKLVIQDSREAKQIISLPERTPTVVTPAANQVVFNPQEGTLILFNSWVRHSLSRNFNKTAPLCFVHMNLSVAQASQSSKPVQPQVEII